MQLKSVTMTMSQLLFKTGLELNIYALMQSTDGIHQGHPVQLKAYFIEQPKAAMEKMINRWGLIITMIIQDSRLLSNPSSMAKSFVEENQVYSQWVRVDLSKKWEKI